MECELVACRIAFSADGFLYEDDSKLPLGWHRFPHLKKCVGVTYIVFAELLSSPYSGQRTNT